MDDTDRPWKPWHLESRQEADPEWEAWRRDQERLEQERHQAEWQEVVFKRPQPTPEQLKYEEWYEEQRRRVRQERAERAAREAEALARMQEESRARAEAEYRINAQQEKTDYEQWLRAQRDQQDADTEKKHRQQLKAAATHRRRQAERAAADARAQAERAALATDSLDNYPDENGEKYLQIKLDDLEKVTTAWEQRHPLDEEEAGAYESAWWQRTDNQREHALARMAQQYLERLAGKPLYQCPWSKMRLIPGGNDMPHRRRRAG